MEFSHCYNAYFHWCVETHQWKVQGFLDNFVQKPCTRTKLLGLESFGFQAFQLCSLRIIMTLEYALRQPARRADRQIHCFLR
ncbi:hypothetical protein B5E56_10545 [Flavonifractor sp. An112]|nr:hypothetical protein B5E56_10545 [Flavonifractor sp. An112]